MTAREKLQALGYGTDAREIERFQRDYNRMPPTRLLPLTGRFDDATARALAEIYEAREMFALLREGWR